MPSTPKIKREEILSGALDLLRREGYSSISIKTVAKELGCSTQPISRQFGSMDGFRAALAQTAMEYAQEKMTSEADNPIKAFFGKGKACVDLAIDEPKLFRFVFMGESGLSTNGEFAKFFNDYRNGKIKKGIAELLSISEEQADFFMNTMVIYTQGMASLIASGIVKEKKKVAHSMLREMGMTFLLAFGVEKERAEALFEA